MDPRFREDDGVEKIIENRKIQEFAMFHGSMVALVTPMMDDGSIDKAAWRHLVDFHLENKTNALIVSGTTGESPTLTDEEKNNLFRLTVDQVKGRIPVIAGTGTNCTAKTIAATKAAMDVGVDACLLTVPYYNCPTQEGIFLHFQAIAKVAPLPLILYNQAKRTGCDMLPETVARLAKFSNIVGVKEGLGELSRLKDLLNLVQGEIDIYSGEDATACDLMLQGAKGVISITANIAPTHMHAMCQAAISGDVAGEKQLDKKLQLLHKVVGVEVNPIPVKWILQQLGLIKSGIRLPLTPLAKRHEETVLSAIREFGLVV